MSTPPLTIDGVLDLLRSSEGEARARARSLAPPDNDYDLGRARALAWAIELIEDTRSIAVGSQ